MLRLRLSTEHHYVFNPSPCLKRVELPLNEQIFNTIGYVHVNCVCIANMLFSFGLSWASKNLNQPK
ncbi:hypothetical protein [Shewanella glacialipiscicola]|uniref:hypothetical protein n=1 Tax=Shewanella glacialipiscicola TaxID=614069 RepID=UPI00200D18E9|nr:hypothetical protein [Shewanella glacialipiscicola]MCL1086800.1 hypothetical protein [Shewanella glacialipiscicola]